MIRRLRYRLILAAMLSLFTVLVLIIGIATGFSYKNLVDEADRTLSMIADNGGEFPVNAPGGEERPRPGESPAPAEGANGARPGRNQGDTSPELPFETRYFSVTLAADGTVSAISLERIYSVDEEGAEEYAAAALSGGRDKGFIDRYRYLVREDEGVSTVYFLSCWQNLRALRRFFLSGAVAALLGMAAVFVLIVLFSARIVRPIAESYDKQRRFVTDAGHDLKTPLSIILADAEVLGMDFGEDNEWLKDIRTQTLRLSELTDDLITLSKMDETMDSGGVSMEALSLSEIVTEAGKSFKNMALSHGLGWQEDIAAGIGINGNKKLIERLVNLILDNAVKYCTQGGDISLELAERGGRAVLRVTNSAEQVSDEDLPHLFERFYRTDRSRNSSTGGYGIGLSIANSIVSMHKGRIAASSADDRSLTISVSFPKGA